MANEVKVKDLGQQAITNMLNQVVSYANLENAQLTPKETQYAVSIITNINKKVTGDKLSWKELDVVGCQLPAQIKRFAKLNLMLENQEIFIDIRNNKNTGLKDITLKMQYQGLEKLMIRYCSKKIVRFYKDVICKGDEIVEKPNLSTGLFELKDHEYAKTDDIDYRNKLENIIGAYANAYVEEDGKLNPYIARIDKNRILRARKSAMTKNIWDEDTRKMVLKTAVWELYSMMKPYMVMPQDVAEDFVKATENDVDFNNRDFINADIEDVREQVEENVASEEITATFGDYDENGEIIEDNQETKFAKFDSDLYD